MRKRERSANENLLGGEYLRWIINRDEETKVCESALPVCFRKANKNGLRNQQQSSAPFGKDERGGEATTYCNAGRAVGSTRKKRAQFASLQIAVLVCSIFVRFRIQNVFLSFFLERERARESGKFTIVIPCHESFMRCRPTPSSRGAA